MGSTTIWSWVDRERTDLADQLEALSADQWVVNSLCDGWTVRDVAAHLTHSQLAAPQMMAAMLGSGFRFNTMMRRLVSADDRRPDQLVAALRSAAGSRRRPPGTTPADPLMDVLVHGQDIAIPLGIDRPMPGPAACVVAEHLWRMRFPMNPRRHLKGVRLVATDADFAVGDGQPVTAPIRDLVLVLSGRRRLSAGAAPA
ncbi:hypothetical protein MMUR_21510 [Mycolicibacterium murale]|jgi:uncharacterized protein (TIGR03083 family)|uniref:Mycothiol-dependent maleylpyruvate isomerase metal-binding domain-containing protein n=1 Tax=Mycolicibacterium murale TaxID=182220 RepID=A0A7I9WJT5_9MYCO|nr:maleylpyruvate isomerase family mycothiol-dependent enzyme [Mycolicibacterium murale]MCV7185305.1 maleylpyruvate isomerase family mycothiol-dependent enzyme [Mycolicibacterium murale]GFG58015.1 hypothetical protein MMUR_21510 [Mycolicibacterium murale]